MVLHLVAKYSCTLSMLSYVASGTASEQDKADYPRWQKKLEDEPYEWQAYKVKTEDGWNLTLFRLLGNPEMLADADGDGQEDYPMLYVHGALDGAYATIGRNIFNDAM